MKKIIISSLIVAMSMLSLNASQSLELGVVKTSGNTENENIDVTYKYEKKLNETTKFNFAANASRAKNAGAETGKSAKAEAKIEKDMNKKLFTYGSVGYLVDKYAGYDSKTNVGVGLGYKIYKNANSSLSTTAGLEYTKKELTNDTSSNYASATIGLAYDRKLNEATKLNFGAKYLQSLKESADKEAKLNLDITSMMAKSLSLKTGILVDWNDNPTPGKKKTDTKTTVNVIYSF